MMTFSGWKTALVVAVSAVLGASAQVPDPCNDLATQLHNDHSLVSTIIKVPDTPACFAQSVNSSAIDPVQASLVSALAKMSATQQQGSSVSSSASTNAVTKPSGTTAIVEEFGGVSTTSGISSTTVQWAPGTMFTNLALNNVVPLCLTTGLPKGCISSAVLKRLSPLTLKVTANTSGGSKVSGTASGSASSTTAQQVTVNSSGSSGPSFAGLTAQYTILGSKAKAVATTVTSPPSYFSDELQTINDSANAFRDCPAYKDWQNDTTQRLTALLNDPGGTPQAAIIRSALIERYQSLMKSMLSTPECKPAQVGFRNLFAAILAAKTYEDFKSVQQSSATPELAVEYDLATPQGKPAYSTVKFSSSWAFGKPTPTDPQAKPAAKPTVAAAGVPAAPTSQQKQQAALQEKVAAYALSQATLATSTAVTSPGVAGQQQKANAQTQADINTQPWALTLSGSADIYSSKPPSTVPSANYLKDIQAGGEISYLFTPSANSGAIRKFIGGITAALAYSYQDQTSPALFTGPALTDFTGLPSSTTTAYAQRGVIHLGQARLGVGTGKNLSFPLAFTYSNRTEFITSPTWGLHFGIAYNLSSLTGSLGSTQ